MSVRERLRLSAESRLGVLAAAGTLAAALLAGFGLQLVDANDSSQRRLDRLATLGQSSLVLDELNESLLADVLAYSSGDVGVRRADAEPDVAELRRRASTYTSLDVSGLWSTKLSAVAADELEYAAMVDQQLPRQDRALVPRILYAAQNLADQLDQLRTSIGAQTARARTETDGVERAARQRFLLTAGLAGLLLAIAAWWTRRSLLNSLARIAGVAQAVALGDFTARNSGSERGRVGELARVVDRMAEALEGAFNRLEVDAERQAFSGRVDRALQRVDNETELAELLGYVLSAAAPELPMELLVADSSESHLTVLGVNATAGGCGCRVGSPWSCPALRTSQLLIQPSGRELDACPRLRERNEGALSAVCLPVSFMGRSLGVLHAAREGSPPGPLLRERLSIVAERTGARLGTLRAMARVEIQAATDSLTGLLNRRAFDDAVRVLTADGREYGLLMADLDHFKQLNDVHGHASGDEALRRFADLLRSKLRRTDVAGRFGGEEFMVALPETDLADALDVAEQIRAALAAGAAGPGVPACTVSIGVTHSSCSTGLAEGLKIADAALMEAKRAGRNRCLAGRGSTGPWFSPGEADPAPGTGRHRDVPAVPAPRRPDPDRQDRRRPDEDLNPDRPDDGHPDRDRPAGGPPASGAAAAPADPSRTALTARGPWTGVRPEDLER